jgi:hypothetical protein
MIVWISDKVVPGSTTLDLVLDEIALTAGLRELSAASRDGKVQQVRRMLRGTPTLLVVDNFETITDESLVVWLPTVPLPSRVLLTSIIRPRIIEDFSLEIEVGGLEEAQRLPFLRQLLKRHSMPDMAADSMAMSEIWHSTHGNPKLLEWALGQYRRRGRGLPDIVAEIGQTRTRAAAEHRGSDYVLGELFRSSWSRINRAEAQVLLAASLFPHGCDVETLRRVAAVGDRFENAIHSLTDLCFLSRQAREFGQTPWYVAEPLVRTRLGDGQFGVDVTAVEDRYFSYWKELTSAIGFCPDDIAKLEVLDVPGMRENLEYAVNLAIETRRHRDVIQIARDARYYYYVRGLWSEERSIHLLRAEAAREIGDPSEEFDARVYFMNIAAKQENLAAVEDQLSRIEEIEGSHRADLSERSVAEYRHARALYLFAKGKRIEAEALWRDNLADEVALGPANYNANLRWLAICISRSAPERAAEARELFALAGNQADRYGYTRARFLIDLELAALALLQRPSRQVIGQILRTLTSEETRARLALLGDRRYEADHHFLVAGCHAQLDDIRSADQYRQKAAELYESLGLVERASQARQEGNRHV